MVDETEFFLNLLSVVVSGSHSHTRVQALLSNHELMVPSLDLVVMPAFQYSFLGCLKLNLKLLSFSLAFLLGHQDMVFFLVLSQNVLKLVLKLPPFNNIDRLSFHFLFLLSAVVGHFFVLKHRLFVAVNLKELNPFDK